MTTRITWFLILVGALFVCLLLMSGWLIEGPRRLIHQLLHRKSDNRQLFRL
jgi:hypothetical protein